MPPITAQAAFSAFSSAKNGEMAAKVGETAGPWRELARKVGDIVAVDAHEEHVGGNDDEHGTENGGKTEDKKRKVDDDDALQNGEQGDSKKACMS
jgi:hypothetical protein